RGGAHLPAVPRPALPLAAAGPGDPPPGARRAHRTVARAGGRRPLDPPPQGDVAPDLPPPARPGPRVVGRGQRPPRRGRVEGPARREGGRGGGAEARGPPRPRGLGRGTYPRRLAQAHALWDAASALEDEAAWRCGLGLMARWVR